ncbi:MAG: DNA-binding protein [Clostridiaceae bacterium]|nr:DNA-binding protein [Clostridiaceae bacterium]
MALPRMRTIPQIAKLFKSKDPDTYINEWYLRGLVKSGTFPCHMAGKRTLICLDALETYLANPPVEPVTEPTYGKIRRISER